MLIVVVLILIWCMTYLVSCIYRNIKKNPVNDLHFSICSVIKTRRELPIVNLSETVVEQNVELEKCVLDVNELKKTRFEITAESVIADIWDNAIKDVRYGGHYSPDECSPEQSVAVIIPYRDRRKHLDILVNNLHSLMQKQQLRYAIYVVELALPIRFNRGLLLNVGYQISRTFAHHNCFIFHDVDLIPTNERNIYRCGQQPRHLATGSSKYNFRIPYDDFLGGVVALTDWQIKEINGFSNAYFGWGGEDDDLAARLKFKSLAIKRPPRHIGRYFALPHGPDVSNPENPERKASLIGAERRMAKDGLNTLQYRLLSIEFRPLYTWVYIECDEMLVKHSIGLL